MTVWGGGNIRTSYPCLTTDSYNGLHSRVVVIVLAENPLGSNHQGSASSVALL